MINTLTQVQIVRSNIERSLKVVESDPMIERQTEYYRANILNITSIDEFMADDRIFNYAMTAMGLEDMIYAKAFMRKVLEEGVSDQSSFANQLADGRYKEFGEVFNFEQFGKATTSFDRAQEGIVDKFHRQTLEVREGEQNQGVRLALYFERKAPGITNAYEVLADRALAETVYTSLGLSQSFAMSDIDKQATYLEENIDFEKLSEPEYLSKFLDRFSALYDLKNGPQAAASPTLAVFSGSGSGVVPMSDGLLTSIQSFRLGGF
ncbi:DUF1217 domain-containing protein [Roseibium denhamense]|uniref:DUF1217 domain-containing protein n=1 Tax=Roseibium denhamense TaxID=76305 RepID=A0ABY1PEY9_9HYPH|nr:DUF1217 domain-containing protein [Roseibium denhamense]MTI06220.1 DUF1217 domain-containing protein [Roseibium denhamense]SMP32688.1 Protein of unknown function [Roseibium denhamense]